MRTISQAPTLDRLKVAYRDLAKCYHPDRGGTAHHMTALNLAYEARRQELERYKKKFSDLKFGDTLFINGTEATVILVTQTKFVARAKGRSKQAWFDIHTGIGVDFPFYQASFTRICNSSNS